MKIKDIYFISLSLSCTTMRTIMILTVIKLGFKSHAELNGLVNLYQHYQYIFNKKTKTKTKIKTTWVGALT